MKLSKTSSKIQQSLTRKLFDMAKAYDNVIDFTLGDPDYQTPVNVREAACKAIHAGKTKYSANAGLVELREIVSANIEKETGVKYNPTNEIIVTVGAMEGLFLALYSMLDEGDEVIIPAPYWINYEHMVLMCNGKPVIVDSSEENNFIVSAEQIKAAITDKTVAIVINSPNNPTGMVYDKDTLKEICKLAKENNVVVFWDECYKSIIYDDAEFATVLDFEGMKDYSVVINSCSKKFSMTGWRVGYVAAPSELVACMTKYQENIAACVSLPSQYAAIEALKEEPVEVQEMKKGFERRRDVLIEGINAIDGLSCKQSQGTFYAFVNIKGTNLDSQTFAYKLLEQQQVAVVPGITYGKCCEGYIRMAYTMNEDRVREGVQRIAAFVEGLSKEE